MKKILLLVAIIVCGYANAQENVIEAPASEGFKKGDIILTGVVAFSSTKTGEIKGSSFAVMPSAGYFVTNNIVLGVSLGYIRTKADAYLVLEDYYEDYEQLTNTFSADAFGRYYFTPANNFSIFGQVSAGFATSKRELSDTNIEYKNNGFGAAFAPGVSYFVSQHLALEASFGIISYTSVTPKTINGLGQETEEDSADNFNVGLNMSNIYFGLIYKF